MLLIFNPSGSLEIEVGSFERGTSLSIISFSSDGLGVIKNNKAKPSMKLSI